MKKQDGPPKEPFRYGDGYPWNPDLGEEGTLRIMRKLGLKPLRAPRPAKTPSHGRSLGPPPN